MNPFSAFLQPTYRTIQGAPSFADLEQTRRGRSQDAFTEKQAGLANTRSNAHLKLQQDYQSRKFSEQDKAEVEGLLAEYQAAEDKGDAALLSRAAQKLQRFGFDVGQRPTAPPRLATQALPSVEQDLSQADFEDKLIAESGNAPVDMGDVDSPEFQADAAAEGPPVDMGDVDSIDFQNAAAQEGQEAPRPLATQTLPVIRKGGKTVYEGQETNRWAPMVAGAFEPFLAHPSQEVQALAKQSQGYSSKLIGTDGYSPKEAIEAGMKHFESGLAQMNQLERTKIGSRRLGSGIGTTPGTFKAMGKTQDTAESIKVYITEAKGQLSKINESDRLLSQAEALASSPDPALQRNAIDILVQSRSGATVSDRERARYDQLEGVLAQAKNYASRWTGGQLDPNYVQMIKNVIETQRSINIATREEIAGDLEEAYVAQNEGKVDAPILERRRGALGKVIRRNADAPSSGSEYGGLGD